MILFLTFWPRSRSELVEMHFLPFSRGFGNDELYYDGLEVVSLLDLDSMLSCDSSCGIEFSSSMISLSLS